MDYNNTQNKDTSLTPQEINKLIKLVDKNSEQHHHDPYSQEHYKNSYEYKRLHTGDHDKRKRTIDAEHSLGDVICRIPFNVNYKYLYELSNILDDKSKNNFIASGEPRYQENLELIEHEVNNALVANPQYVLSYNIIIPVIYLNNDYTDAFSDWIDNKSGVAGNTDLSHSRIAKKCLNFEKNMKKVYYNPKNFVNLSLKANFIIPIAVNPVNKFSSPGQPLIKNHPNPLIAKFVNKHLNHEL